jgi:flagellar motor switch protein FliG
MATVMAEAPSGNPDGMTGAEQAAALLLSIEPSQAAKVLRRFDQEELRLLARALTGLGEVDNSALESLFEKFFARFSAGAALRGGAGQARMLLGEAFPSEQVAEVLSEAFGGDPKSVWRAIASLPEQRVAEYLAGEHPQVASYILSKLDVSFVGKVIQSLPRELRNETLSRMVSPAEIPEPAARLIEETLREDLIEGAARSTSGSECAKVANIINSLEPQNFGDIVSEIGKEHPTEAKIIRKMLFSFDDLARLSRRALAIIFDKAPTDLVVLALRGTDPAFREVVLSTLASRARRLVESELNSASLAPPRDIARARKDIVSLVLSLAQRGEIEIAPADESNAEGDGLDA